MIVRVIPPKFALSSLEMCLNYVPNNSIFFFSTGEKSPEVQYVELK